MDAKTILVAVWIIASVATIIWCFCGARAADRAQEAHEEKNHP